MNWPRTESGQIALDEDTFREQAGLHPEVEPLQQVRQMLGQLHHPGLHVGSDGRNRCLLSPFKTKTGRNAPSTAHFIFAAPSFLRSLIRPEPGSALGYIDWVAQEVGVAAALSGDATMKDSYQSGDVYLAFAKLAGAVPPEATKDTHPRERDLFKKVILGAQYCIGVTRLASQLGVSQPIARDLLEQHRRFFSAYWYWLDAVGDYGQLQGKITATFGWTLHVTEATSLRTLRNFPMQANASEMLRLAAVFAHHAGVSIVGLVHDALLIEASDRDIEHAAAEAESAMHRASELVLDGFPLRTETKIIRSPNCFPEKRGRTMWEWITEMLPSIEKPVVA